LILINPLIQIGAGIGQGLKNVLGIAAGQVVGFAAAPILGAGIGALANGAFTEDENERRRRRIVGALMGGAVGAAAAPLVSSIGGYAGAKMAAIENLSRADREKCMTDGILFIDKRAAEEKSLAVETEYTNRFSAPKANGFYEILNRGGELQKVFVGLSPFIVEAPKSAIPGSMLLDIESGVYIVPSFSNQIFVRSQLTPAEAVWKEKFTGMTKPSGMETGKHYILVSPSLKVSAPFKVSNKIKAGDEMQFVCETGWAMRYRAVGTNSYPEPAGCCGSSFGSGTGYSGTIVKVVDREDESSVSRVGNITLVPSSWRVQEVYGNSGDLNYDWATSTPFGEDSTAYNK
jgi:hypothetical protein